jgi:hypothetical protein
MGCGRKLRWLFRHKALQDKQKVLKTGACSDLLTENHYIKKQYFYFFCREQDINPRHLWRIEELYFFLLWVNILSYKSLKLMGTCTFPAILISVKFKY